MKLSRTVTYAVQATLQLAECNGNAPVPCSQLAAAGNMPERFLLQILRHLVTHDILNSTRGVDGGYSLGRRPQDISLLDVIEAIDGPLAATTPSLGNGDPTPCELKLRSALEQITLDSRRKLDAVKLSDLLADSALAKRA
jgi:Rrf2 family protein